MLSGHSLQNLNARNVQANMNVVVEDVRQVRIDLGTGAVTGGG